MNQNQSENLFLTEKRKYKTISSIPKECKEYNILKSYIELEKLLFHKSSDKESLFNEIVAIIEQNEGNRDHILQYLIEMFIYFILIRPKQQEISCFLLSKLLSKYENKHDFIINTIKENENYSRNIHIKDVLYSQGIVEEEPQDYESRKETILSIYEKDSLEYILKEDDVNKLKDYINYHNDLSGDFEIDLMKNSPVHEILKKHILFGIEKVKILDFCSFYGSIECFKFLKANGYEYGKYFNEMSICGGNLEIIHEVEQSGNSFDNCFAFSIQFHQDTIKEWLLANYKCELLSLTICLEYFDYETFLFLLLNEVDINEGNITPIGYLCNQKLQNNEIIKLLIERGADVNKTCQNKHGNSNTPLCYLCQQKDINIEAIKILIEGGADVNKGENEYCCTPLCYLCQQRNVNFEAIKLLVEKGADVNKGDCYYKSLIYLCQNEHINKEIIKFLIDHGATINEEDLLFVNDKGV